MDNTKKYYEYLKGAGADIPPTFESFSKTLSNEDEAKLYFDYLKSNDFDTPETFESFYETLGLKKKDFSDSDSPSQEDSTSSAIPSQSVDNFRAAEQEEDIKKAGELFDNNLYAQYINKQTDLNSLRSTLERDQFLTDVSSQSIGGQFTQSLQSQSVAGQFGATLKENPAIAQLKTSRLVSDMEDITSEIEEKEGSFGLVKLGIYASDMDDNDKGQTVKAFEDLHKELGENSPFMRRDSMNRDIDIAIKSLDMSSYPNTEEGMKKMQADISGIVGGIAQNYYFKLEDGQLVDTRQGVVDDYIQENLEQQNRPGFLRNLYLTLSSGSDIANAAMTDVLGFVTGLNYFDWYQQGREGYKIRAEATKEKATRYQDGFEGYLDKGDIGKAIGAVITGVGESMPMMIPVLLSAWAGNPNMGLYVMGAMSTSTKYREIENMDIPEWQKILNSVTSGLNEVVFERIFTVPILMRSKIALSELGEETIRGQIRNISKSTVKNFFPYIPQIYQGGIEEVFTEMNNNFVDMLTIDPDRKISDGLLDAFAAGVVMAGAFASPQAASWAKRKFKSPDLKRDFVKSIATSLPDGLTVEQKTEVASKMVEVAILEDKAKTNPKIQESTQQQIDDINQEIDNIIGVDEAPQPTDTIDDVVSRNKNTGRNVPIIQSTESGMSVVLPNSEGAMTVSNRSEARDVINNIDSENKELREIIEKKEQLKAEDEVSDKPYRLFDQRFDTKEAFLDAFENFRRENYFDPNSLWGGDVIYGDISLSEMLERSKKGESQFPSDVIKNEHLAEKSIMERIEINENNKETLQDVFDRFLPPEQMVDPLDEMVANNRRIIEEQRQRIEQLKKDAGIEGDAEGGVREGATMGQALERMDAAIKESKKLLEPSAQERTTAQETQEGMETSPYIDRKLNDLVDSWNNTKDFVPEFIDYLKGLQDRLSIIKEAINNKNAEAVRDAIKEEVDRLRQAYPTQKKLTIPSNFDKLQQHLRLLSISAQDGFVERGYNRTSDGKRGDLVTVGTTIDAFSAIERAINKYLVETVKGEVAETAQVETELPVVDQPKDSNKFDNTENTKKAITDLAEKNSDKVEGLFKKFFNLFRDRQAEVLKEEKKAKDIGDTDLAKKIWDDFRKEKIDIISNAYHQAKKDGENPQLVKAVEGLFTEKVERTKRKPETLEESPNYPFITIDKDGNYVFFHYSQEKRGTLDPKFGGKNPALMSRAEMAAFDNVLQYYTTGNFREAGVGEHLHIVRVSKDKVYDFQADPLNLIEEAKQRFDKSKGNSGVAFTPNDQVAWVTKVAAEKGYDFVVANWEAKGYSGSRAHSVVELTPSQTFDISKGETPSETFQTNLDKHQKTDGITIEKAPKGVFVNVGLKVDKTGEILTSDHVLSSLPQGVDVVRSERIDENSGLVEEPTLSIELSRPLTDAEMVVFLNATKQKAIPHLSNGEGVMHGTLDWGNFNQKLFIMPDKQRLSDVTVPPQQAQDVTQTMLDKVNNLIILTLGFKQDTRGARQVLADFIKENKNELSKINPRRIPKILNQLNTELTPEQLQVILGNLKDAIVSAQTLSDKASIEAEAKKVFDNIKKTTKPKIKKDKKIVGARVSEESRVKRLVNKVLSMGYNEASSFFDRVSRAEEAGEDVSVDELIAKEYAELIISTQEAFDDVMSKNTTIAEKADALNTLKQNQEYFKERDSEWLRERKKKEEARREEFKKATTAGTLGSTKMFQAQLEIFVSEAVGDINRGELPADVLDNLLIKLRMNGEHKKADMIFNKMTPLIEQGLTDSKAFNEALTKIIGGKLVYDSVEAQVGVEGRKNPLSAFESFEGMIHTVFGRAGKALYKSVYDYTVKRVKESRVRWENMYWEGQKILKQASKFFPNDIVGMTGEKIGLFEFNGRKSELGVEMTLKEKVRKEDGEEVVVALERAVENYKQLSYANITYLATFMKDPANVAELHKKFTPDSVARLVQRVDNIMNGESPLITKAGQKQLQDYVEFMETKFYPWVYDQVNEVYQRMYNAALPKSEYAYIPRFVANRIANMMDLSLDGTTNRQTSTPFMTSPHIKTKTGSQDVDVLRNSMVVADNYLRSMVDFAAFAETKRDITQFFRDKEVRRSIKRLKGGQNYLDIFNAFVEDIPNPKKDVEANKNLWLHLYRNMMLSVLRLNPGVFVTQLGSAPNFVEAMKFETNWKRFIPGLQTATWMKEMATLDGWLDYWDAFTSSAFVNIRLGKGFDATLMAANRNLFIERLMEWSNMKGTSTHARLAAINEFIMSEVGMGHIRLGDIGAFLGGKPVFVKLRDALLRDGFSPEDASKTAMEAVTSAGKSAQQSFYSEDRSHFQRRSPWSKMFYYFTTKMQYQQKVNMAGRNIVRDVQKGAFPNADDVDNLFRYGVLQPVIYRGIKWLIAMSLFSRDTKEEEELKDDQMAKIGAVLENAAPFIQGVPLIGDAADNLGRNWQGKDTYAFKAGGFNKVLDVTLGAMELGNTLERDDEGRIQPLSRRQERLLDNVLNEGFSVTGLNPRTMKKWIYLATGDPTDRKPIRGIDEEVRKAFEGGMTMQEFVNENPEKARERARKYQAYALNDYTDRPTRKDLEFLLTPYSTDRKVRYMMARMKDFESNEDFYQNFIYKYSDPVDEWGKVTNHRLGTYIKIDPKSGEEKELYVPNVLTRSVVEAWEKKYVAK